VNLGIPFFVFTISFYCTMVSNIRSFELRLDWYNMVDSVAGKKVEWVR